MDDLIDSHTRKSLALALLAYEGGDRELSKLQINERLGQCEHWFGKYTTVWGPAYHHIKRPLIHRFNKENSIDSMAFIVQDLDCPTDYYIVIRGTNPRNLYEWIFQDFWVGNLIPWNMVPYEDLVPPSQPSTTIPAISFGANIAFTLLVKFLKDSDSGKSIEDFIKSLTSQFCGLAPAKSGPKIVIHLTGHSLGGTLATTLALYLNENWSGVFKPDIISYNFAGPTVGNQEFADLSGRVLGDHYKRYANVLDVVTQVWNRESMEKLPIIYNENRIPIPHLLLKVLYGLAIPAVYDKKYTHIGEYQAVPSKVVPLLDQYVAQMVFQHLIPYIAELNRQWASADQAELIKLMESWEVFNLFRSSKPLRHFKNKNLQYFLELLN
jgi:pimeloyl-ACP methyl ester carboxylesterase